MISRNACPRRRRGRASARRGRVALRHHDVIVVCRSRHARKLRVDSATNTRRLWSTRHKSINREGVSALFVLYESITKLFHRTMVQKRYWILTIPADDWSVPDELPEQLQYLRGQQEVGAQGFRHWQLLAAFKRTVRLSGVKELFGRTCHAEPTRSAAANEYVWKEDTRVEGTQFDVGKCAFKRNSRDDWDAVWESAKHGRFEEIPANVRVNSYNALCRIAKDHMVAEPMERTVHVYWGRTGTGKSRRAWEEAGWDAYPKIPSTKFWDGYQEQEHVVIDEFTGQVGIEHLLRWFDRYPVTVETKGSACVFKAKRIWVTSNVDPRDWYPTAPESQKEALLRRLNIIHFPGNAVFEEAERIFFEYPELMF